ncbi:MAG: hypothetical protein DRP63_01405 [Planctomycetota bacterium]|nr:MAG: hypothetical protein DRP63_01405 [Planctomycetota bacterium]
MTNEENSEMLCVTPQGLQLMPEPCVADNSLSAIFEPSLLILWRAANHARGSFWAKMRKTVGYLRVHGLRFTLQKILGKSKLARLSYRRAFHGLAFGTCEGQVGIALIPAMTVLPERLLIRRSTFTPTGPLENAEGLLYDLWKATKENAETINPDPLAPTDASVKRTVNKIRLAIDSWQTEVNQEPVSEVPILRFPMSSKRIRSVAQPVIVQFDNTAQKQHLQHWIRTFKAPRTKTKTPRISVIGTGNFAATVLIPYLRRHSLELVAACDIRPERATAVARGYGFQIATTDPEVAMQNVDAVVIATYHASHAHLVSMAIRKGLHMFVEKPLCVTQPDLTRLSEILKEQVTERRVFMVGYNRPYAPATKKLKGVLSRLSGPTIVVCGVKLYDLQPWSYYRWPNQGSRVITNACHWIDFCLSIINAAPLAVQTFTSTSSPIDEDFTICISFADGSLASLTFSSHGERLVDGRETIIVYKEGCEFRIDDFATLCCFQRGKKRVFGRWKRKRGHKEIVSAFVRRLRERIPTTRKEIQHVLLVQHLCFLADLSLRNGHKIQVDKMFSDERAM